MIGAEQFEGVLRYDSPRPGDFWVWLLSRERRDADLNDGVVSAEPRFLPDENGCCVIRNLAIPRVVEPRLISPDQFTNHLRCLKPKAHLYAEPVHETEQVESLGNLQGDSQDTNWTVNDRVRVERHNLIRSCFHESLLRSTKPEDN